MLYSLKFIDNVTYFQCVLFYGYVLWKKQISFLDFK